LIKYYNGEGGNHVETEIGNHTGLKVNVKYGGNE